MIAVNSVPTANTFQEAEIRAVSVIDIIVSTDAGNTWTRSELPYPSAILGEVGGTIVYDADVAIASNGTIYVAGIVSHDVGSAFNPPLGHARAFITTSADRGKSWTPPTVVSSPYADRPWLSIRPNGDWSLVWTQSRQTLGAAWAANGTLEHDDQIASCIFLSRPIAERFLCTQLGSKPVAREFELDGRPRPLATSWSLPEPGLANNVADQNHSLAVVDALNSNRVLLLSRSDASNISANLLDDTPASQWTTHRLFAASRDPYGNLHIIVEGSSDAAKCDPQNGQVYRKTPGGCEIYQIETTSKGKLVRFLDLRPGVDSAPSTQTPSSTLAYTGDDYATITFAGDGGTMAWASGGAIYMTLLVPRFMSP